MLVAFHPFYAVTLTILALVWAAVSTLGGGLREKTVLGTGLYGLFLLPSAIFHLGVTISDASWAAINAANVTRTPGLLAVVAGFGFFLPLAAIGAVRLAREGQYLFRRKLIAVWAVLGLLLPYLPLYFNRRLMEGVFLPLAALSVPALETLWRRLSAWAGVSAFGLAAAVFALALVPTSVFNLASATAFYDGASGNASALDDADMNGLLSWCRGAAADGTAVLASPDTSMRLAGWCGATVYIAHFVETPDVPQKSARLARFLESDSDAERRRFLAENGFRFIVLESRFNPWVGRLPAWLTAVYGNAKYRVLRVAGAK